MFSKKLRVVYSATEKKRHKAIYLLPNAFTTAALFCGFYAIVMTFYGLFATAITAIFYAMILDGLDGRIARMTRTQSSFGEQFDSLSDVIAFGVAPSILAYQYILHQMGKWGLAIAFIFCAAGALRLARFNANIGVASKSFFQGLPIPAASANLTGLIWLRLHDISLFNMMDDYIKPVFYISFWMVYLSLAMVSNLPFYSGKSLSIGQSVPFKVLVIFLIFFVILFLYPSIVLSSVFFIYAISGLLLWVYFSIRKYKNHLSRKV